MEEEQEKSVKDTLTYLIITFGKSFLVVSILIFYLIIVPIPYYFIEGFSTKFFDFGSPGSYFDVVYLSFTTVTTVGYGDIFPKTIFGRIFWIVYAAFGIFIMALAIGYIIGIVFEILDIFILHLNKYIKTLFFKERKKYIKFQLTPFFKIVAVLNFISWYCLLFGLVIAAIEEWDFGTGLWYSYITMTTIGYGDTSPETNLGRVFYMIFSFVGLGLISVLFGFIGEFLIDSNTQEIKTRMEKIYSTLYNKLDAKISSIDLNDLKNAGEEKNEIELKDVKSTPELGKEDEVEFKENPKNEMKNTSFVQKLKKESFPILRTFLKKGFTIGITILSYPIILFVLPIPLWIIESKNEMEQTGLNDVWTYGNVIYLCITTFTTVGYGDLYPTTANGRIYMIFLSFIGLIQFGYFISSFGSILKSSLDLISESLKLTLKRLLLKYPKTAKVATTLLTIANDPLGIILLIGMFTIVYFIFFCGFIGLIEGWYFHNALWYGFITFTTIGYGDMYPITPGGKIFYSIGLIGGISIASLFISNLFDYFLKRSKDQLMRNIRKSYQFLQTKLGSNEEINQQDIEKAEDMSKSFQ
eukprot:gene9314-1402_t